MAKAKRAQTNVVSLSSRWENTFGLHLLPIGDGLLTPEAAAKWLDDDAGIYGELIIACAGCEGREVHDALLWDLGYMARAAGRALTKQKPVKLCRTTAVGSSAFENHLKGLAHLLSHFEAAFDDVQRQEQRVLGALPRELEARLALATEVQR